MEVSDDLNKAEILNSQFKSVFTREPITSELPNKVHSPHPDMSQFIITEESVLTFNHISTLNIHKACGPNLMNAIFLKQTSLVIAPFITKLFQMSLDSGDIPTDWKAAYVSPIFKKVTKDSWELWSGIAYFHYLQTP